MEIPKLQYAEGISNNFADFKRKLALKATYEYGNLARIIESPELGYWDPEASYAGDPLVYDAEADTFVRQMERAKIIKSAEARDKYVEEMKADRPALFALIFAHLSPSSEHKVKEDETWATVFAARDPLLLWRIIKKTHVAPTTGQTEIDKMTIRRIYNGLAQGKGETVYDFRERFNRTLEMRKSLGIDDPDAETIAQDFLDKLDPSRFESMKTALMNGLREFPKSIQAVYTMASNWRVEGKLAASLAPSLKANQGNTISSSKTSESSSSSSSSTVFKTSEENIISPNSKEGGGKKKGKNKNKKGGNGGGQQEAANREQSGENKSNQFKCFACGRSDHSLQACAKFQKFIAQEAQGSSVMTTTSSGGSRRNNVRFSDADDDDFHLLCMTREESCTHCYEDPCREIPSDPLVLVSSGVEPDMNVLLDSQANVSVFREPSLLISIRQAPLTKRIGGIASEAMVVNQVGDHPDFGTIYFHPQASANVLCQFDMANKMGYRIELDARAHSYRMSGTKTGSVYVFSEKNKLAVCACLPALQLLKNVPNFSTALQLTTVDENLRSYTKREIAAAESARELQARLGFPSDKTLCEIVNKGINNSPITSYDVLRASRIFGPNVASLKGKTVTKTGEPVKVEYVPPPIVKDQTLEIDVMFIDRDPYLISVSNPLNLTLCTHLENKGKDLQSKLIEHIHAYSARGFKVGEVRCDGEAIIQQSRSLLASMNVGLDVVSKGQHVPKPERMCRVIKERVRAHINTLPFILPFKLLKFLVMFCVATINMQPCTNHKDRVSPRELFTQRKLDFKRDLRVSFGEYVFVPTEPSIKNSMDSRAVGCIALYPTGSRQGSVKFYNLATDSIISRTQWKSVPMPREVIEYINSLAHLSKYKVSNEPIVQLGINKRGLLEESENVLEDVKDQDYTQTLEGPLRDPFSVVQDEDEKEQDDFSTVLSPPSSSATKQQTIIRINPVDSKIPDPTEPVDCSSVSNPDDEDSSDPPNLEEIPAVVKINPPMLIPEEVVIKSPSRPSRTASSRNWKDGPARFRSPEKTRSVGFHVSVKKSLAIYGKVAEVECKRELQQMLDKKVWHGVKYADLNHNQRRKIIRSKMFIKEKFLPNGTFDKLKARLVSGGDQQDRSLYSDVSSPTVALSSVFMVSSLAAQSDQSVATADVGGAYLNADMTSEVYIRLDAIIAAMLVELDPDFEKFLNFDGTIIVRLDKALYGCIESGKLWYENIRAYLESNGFLANPHDICVFNEGQGEDQVTICLYVDDLLITSSNSIKIDNFLQRLKDHYRELKVTRGKVHNYLGMRFDFSTSGKCEITMEGFMEECIKAYEIVGSAATPALPNLFEIDETSVSLEESKANEFHSRVAKLLYLAKRCRPDILCAIAFLTTRVKNPTVQDNFKLDRVLKYLAGTKEMGLVLEIGNILQVRSYVDASFGVHVDYKGHTGGAIYLGKSALVFSKSAKQKLMGKSSTETELVATSELLPQVIHSRNFLLAQGHQVSEALMYQDNKSTMALIKKGRSTAESTRHIAIRFYFIKDRVESNELKIEYMPTEDMVADILTKPLQGELFRRLRAKLLNWE
jgi:hypothetical protein